MNNSTRTQLCSVVHTCKILNPCAEPVSIVLLFFPTSPLEGVYKSNLEGVISSDSMKEVYSSLPAYVVYEQVEKISEKISESHNEGAV